MTFVFRNNTIERFMPAEYEFSGYDDISVVPDEATDFVWWYQVPIRFDIDSLVAEVETYISKLNLILPSIGNRQLNIITLADFLSVSIETSDDRLMHAINEYNDTIYHFAKEHSNIRIIDISSFYNKYSAAELIDWKLYFLSQMSINPKLATAFKEWYSLQLKAISLQRKKCIVLDLDNTLWGGVLGEDGLNQIAISGSYPGKAYNLWQQGLRQLKQKGVLLCICSKNNIEDVEEVWNKRADMVLKQNDFAAVRINWQDKVTNISELAKELNIGLDSMVFIDDNPTERELVRQLLPMVEVPDFPLQPYDLPKLYKQLVEKYFQTYNITAEDKQKTEQYRLNALRNEAASHYSDMTEYLRSLEMQLTIEPINEQTLPRAAQLTQKTNQFNLTTKRYAEADLRSLINNGAYGWTLDVADKFGDYGITGLIIVNAEGMIDTMLMSCRVLGKGVENAFIRIVLYLLRKKGFQTITGQYIKTSKNSQTANFYPNNGFELIEHNGDNNAVYSIRLSDADLSVNDYLKINVDQ